MLLVRTTENDPYFNLAMEEYLLCTLREDCISLWVNDTVIVVGRNQNTRAEINEAFVREHGIRVVRRLTGGGAVFHDLGNLNFTYIESAQGGRFNDYAYFTEDLRGYLATLGVKAELSGRNDLLIEGRKFAGNAQCIRGGRVMHHGCILLSADLSRLAGALNANPLKMESKGSKSVASRVTNVADHLPRPVSCPEFKAGFEAYLLAAHPGLVPYDLTDADNAAIRRLRDEKYATWQWNFGESPSYNFRNAKRFEGCGVVELCLSVEGGVIRGAAVQGDFFGVRDASELSAKLIGVRHDRDAVLAALCDFPVSECIHGVTAGEFAELLV